MDRNIEPSLISYHLLSMPHYNLFDYCLPSDPRFSLLFTLEVIPCRRGMLLAGV